MLSILLTDLLYVLVDPRISSASRRGNRHDAPARPIWTSSGGSSRRTGPRCGAVALVPLLLLAIFAPLLASNQPLVFHHGQTVYPWLRALFNTEEPVDFAFNMALVGFLPGMVLAAVIIGLWGGAAGSVRAGATSWRPWPSHVAVAAVLCADGLLGRAAAGQFLLLAGTSPRSEFTTPASRHGLYAPIPFGPTEQDLASVSSRPGFRKPTRRPGTRSTTASPHLLGTDDSGRDVLVRMLYGTRISLTVGFVAVGIYLAIGIVLGAVAGYFGGTVDMLISRSSKS